MSVLGLFAFSLRTSFDPIDSDPPDSSIPSLGPSFGRTMARGFRNSAVRWIVLHPVSFLSSKMAKTYTASQKSVTSSTAFASPIRRLSPAHGHHSSWVPSNVELERETQLGQIGNGRVAHPLNGFEFSGAGLF